MYDSGIVTWIPLIYQLVAYAVPLGFGVVVIVLLYKIYKRLGQIQQAAKSDACGKQSAGGTPKEPDKEPEKAAGKESGGDQTKQNIDPNTEL